MIIGLTGQIGAGKSSVAGTLRKLGAVVVDADLIGRELVESNRAISRSLTRAFGSHILNKQGKIDRRALATVAFASEKSRSQLNKIIHPALLKELGNQVRAALKSRKVVVVDAALLIEWKLDRKVDLVLVVSAPRELRLKRMVDKGFSRADILRRMKRQLSAKAFAEKADVVIANTGSKADLARAVKFLFSQPGLPK